MKLSINEGPFVNGRKLCFAIGEQHCKEICAYLWDWKIKLPKEVQNHIEVITINPNVWHEKNQIVIRVVLSGGGDKPWKIDIEETSTYSHFYKEGQDPPKENINLEDLGKKLTNQILWELENHYKLHGDVYNRLAKLISLMKE